LNRSDLAFFVGNPQFFKLETWRDGGVSQCDAIMGNAPI
jgi:hypothetical protein